MYLIGDVVTLSSINRDVEQFHTIAELTGEKGMPSTCNSVVDFRSLESGNPASDSYWENRDLYRRYTLPRGFKPRFTRGESKLSNSESAQHNTTLIARHTT